MLKVSPVAHMKLGLLSPSSSQDVRYDPEDCPLTFSSHKPLYHEPAQKPDGINGSNRLKEKTQAKAPWAHSVHVFWGEEQPDIHWKLEQPRDVFRQLEESTIC